jgi:hypothetical protein
MYVEEFHEEQKDTATPVQFCAMADTPGAGTGPGTGGYYLNYREEPAFNARF